MTFAAEYDYISLLRKGKGVTDSLFAVGNNGVLSALLFNIGRNLPANLFGVFKVGVVRGNDGKIAHCSGNKTQLLPSYFAPSADRAEKRNYPAGIVGSCGFNYAFEADAVVRVVDNNGEVFSCVKNLAPPFNKNGFKSLFNLLFLCAEAFADGAGANGVVCVDLAGEGNKKAFFFSLALKGKGNAL